MIIWNLFDSTNLADFILINHNYLKEKTAPFPTLNQNISEVTKMTKEYLSSFNEEINHNDLKIYGTFRSEFSFLYKNINSSKDDKKVNNTVFTFIGTARDSSTNYNINLPTNNIEQFKKLTPSVNEVHNVIVSKKWAIIHHLSLQSVYHLNFANESTSDNQSIAFKIIGWINSPSLYTNYNPINFVGSANNSTSCILNYADYYEIQNQLKKSNNF